MNNDNHKFNFSKTSLILTMALIWLSKLVKFSFIMGSVRAFFSLVNVTGPLAVVCNGLSGGAWYLLLSWAFCAKANFVWATLLTSSGFPNLLAGFYWRSSTAWIKIGLPSLCMVLFWSQTWGTVGMAYALLWLIPIFINISKCEQVYLKSLAATFVAHGVGSVFWVYGANLAPEQWLSLIPVAIAERIFLAILMGFVYNLLQISSQIKFFNFKTILQSESASL